MTREYTLDELDRLARNRFLLGLLGAPLVLTLLCGGVAFLALGGAAKLRALVSETERHRQTARECRFNLNSLRTAEQAYNAEYDEYVATGWAPAEPGRVGWDKAQSFGMPEGFAEVGWVPDGRVYGTYRVRLTETGFEAECRMDLDLDGEWAIFRATERARAERVTPDGVF